MKDRCNKEFISFLATAIEDVEYIKDNLLDNTVKGLLQSSYALGQLQVELCAFYHKINTED